jgi:hypothetical protein
MIGMKLRRIAKWIAIILFTVIAGALFYFFVIIDRSNSPLCHKNLYFSFVIWAEDNTNVFANVNGSSVESLNAMDENLGNSDYWVERYNYIPGLRKDDPEELILMYLKRPTRWIHHVRPQTIFQKKSWMIYPLESFSEDIRVGGEYSQRISAAEFKQRLQQTLDFLRTNQRPNWEAVVAEHTKFLQSIPD